MVANSASIVPPDLESRFSEVKRNLVKDEDRQLVTDSWKRLLRALESETKAMENAGPSRIPTIQWEDIKKNNFQLTEKDSESFKKAGVVLVKGVIDRPQIDTWFEELAQFCKDHPETAGYTLPNPTSWYNLFWTKPQTEARFHENTKKLFQVLSNEFYVEDIENSLIDLDTQVVYGDRIRIRQPGTKASLNLHLDSSSIERWEDATYRDTYKQIFEGHWEDWDPYKLDKRQFAREDLYHHLDTKRPTICSSFRTLQGWLALSDNKTGEGTLRVFPNVKLGIAYILLRPLFWKDPESGNIDDYEIDLETPKFPGAVPSTGQLFIDDEFYPHLRQCEAVVGIPDVQKGDFMFWHADIPHEVDKEHNGDGHSSVFYYGVTPLSVTNIPTLLDTKESFLANISPEDYRSQLGDAKEYQGADIANITCKEGLRSMGLEPFEISGDLSNSQKRVRQLANNAIAEGKFDLHTFLKSI
ncbi:hypothetical protein CAAN3_08S02520 [[Candida] anglica]